MRLLILLPTSPLPVFSGGHQRMYQMIRRLALRCDVTVLAFWRDEEARAGLERLETELPIEVVPVPFRRLRTVRGMFSMLWWQMQQLRRERLWDLPLDVLLWNQPAMHSALRHLLRTRTIDVVQVEWPYLAPYALANPQLPNLLVAYDVFSVALNRRARLIKDTLRRRIMQRQVQAWASYETKILPQFGCIAAMSNADADVMRQRAPTANVVVLPNGVDTVAMTPGEIRPQVERLLFVGSTAHAPNLDAARWLLTEIWPVVHAQHPDLRLTLVNLDHPQIREALQPGVELLGRLPDLAPVYRRSDLVLVPLRAGSGTRLKILEAFALGVPVISTRLGHEGLEVEPGKHLLSADTPDAFAAAITQLMTDLDTRRQLVENGRRLAVAQYDWEHITDLHMTVCNSLITAQLKP